jgi:hypothetical protein
MGSVYSPTWYICVYIYHLYVLCTSIYILSTLYYVRLYTYVAELLVNLRYSRAHAEARGVVVWR